MRKWITKLFFIHCCFFLILYDASVAYGEPTLEETRMLLQKGITIYEIDREIDRLSAKEKELEIEILDVEEEINIQEATVDTTKKRAGDVLRSYYMGEKDSLLLMFFAADNFADALAVWEFVHIIFESDQKILNRYLTSYQQLQELHSILLKTQNDIQQIKEQFLSQRQKLVLLQEELDQQLAIHPEEAQLEELIADLTASWKNTGLPIFRSYFKALGEAMQQLPEITAYYNNIISFKGTAIEFQITDVQLNEFLLSKNEMFKNFTFDFKDGFITASGKEDDISATIKGQYSLIEEPQNAIRFHVNELMYNGFVLPETTSKALEEEFDLGVYPQKFDFLGYKLKATEVHMNSGKLNILLKLE